MLLTLNVEKAEKTSKKVIFFFQMISNPINNKYYLLDKNFSKKDFNESNNLRFPFTFKHFQMIFNNLELLKKESITEYDIAEEFLKYFQNLVNKNQIQLIEKLIDTVFQTTIYLELYNKK